MLIGTPGRMLARYGSPYTLWRRSLAAGAKPWDAGAPTDAFYTCRARERAPKPMQVQGTLVETARLIVVDAGSLSVVPQKGDRLAIGSYTANGPGVRWQEITNVDIPYMAGSAAVYRCTVSE